jgi:hypothetical protein
VILGLWKLDAFSFSCLINPRDVPKPSPCCSHHYDSHRRRLLPYIHVGTELFVLLISFSYYYYYSISPMQVIYNYISEANHISGVYNFAAVLHLQFIQHVLFFPVLNMFCAFYIITFRSMCAVPSMAAFFSSLIYCFPGIF